METFKSCDEGFTVPKNKNYGYLSLFKFEISKFYSCFLHSCLSVKLPAVTRNIIQMEYQKLEHFEKEKNDLLSICVVWPTTKKKDKKKPKKHFTIHGELNQPLMKFIPYGKKWQNIK